MTGAARATLATLGRDVRARLAGHDVLLAAAGVTFYAGVALVPLLLDAVWAAGLLLGHARMLRLGTAVADVLPPHLGARAAAEHLVRSATGLRPGLVLAALVPATFYGEGLRRAFSRLSPSPDEGVVAVAWKARLVTLALLAVAPLGVVAGVVVTAELSAALGTDALGSFLGTGAAYAGASLLMTVVLALAYRGLSPERPSLRPLLVGAGVTGLVTGGQLVTFVLFLHLPLHPGGAFGGSEALGAATTTAGWLLALHVIVLLGYVLTVALDARTRAARTPAGGSPYDVERDLARVPSV